jgi:hypothetical protein
LANEFQLKSIPLPAHILADIEGLMALVRKRGQARNPKAAAAKRAKTMRARHKAKRQAMAAEAKARAKEAGAAYLAAKAEQRARGERSIDRVVRAFRSGEWQSERDLVAASGAPRKSVSAYLHQKLEPRGLVERARNELWRGETGAHLGHDPARRNRQGGGSRGFGPREAKYLWRLTAAGEAEKGRLDAGAPGTLRYRA